MTTPASRPRIPTRRGLWIGSLFLVLAGLFGMHGLACHGPCDMPAMPGELNRELTLPDAVDGSMLGAISAHEAHGITEATSTTASPATGMPEDVAHVALATGGRHGHGQGKVGLCLAVLAGALLVLAHWIRRPALRLTVPVSRRLVTLRGLGRDPDPPSLTWLAIRRC
jgi:hypothetical protein